MVGVSWMKMQRELKTPKLFDWLFVTVIGIELLQVICSVRYAKLIPFITIFLQNT